jgi:hypothetical protein
VKPSGHAAFLHTATLAGAIHTSCSTAIHRVLNTQPSGLWKRCPRCGSCKQVLWVQTGYHDKVERWPLTDRSEGVWATTPRMQGAISSWAAGMRRVCGKMWRGNACWQISGDCLSHPHLFRVKVDDKGQNCSPALRAMLGDLTSSTGCTCDRAHDSGLKLLLCVPAGFLLFGSQCYPGSPFRHCSWTIVSGFNLCCLSGLWVFILFFSCFGDSHYFIDT